MNFGELWGETKERNGKLKGSGGTKEVSLPPPFFFFFFICLFFLPSPTINSLLFFFFLIFTNLSHNHKFLILSLSLHLSSHIRMNSNHTNLRGNSGRTRLCHVKRVPLNNPILGIIERKFILVICVGIVFRRHDWWGVVVVLLPQRRTRANWTNKEDDKKEKEEATKRRRFSDGGKILSLQDSRLSFFRGTQSDFVIFFNLSNFHIYTLINQKKKKNDRVVVETKKRTLLFVSWGRKRATFCFFFF